MSSFKRVNNSDVVVSPYIANKQWDFKSCNLPGNDIQIFFGSKMTESFSAENDPVTYDRYERLVYDTINNTYYQSFSGSFLNDDSNLQSLNYESASIYRASGSYYSYSEEGYTVRAYPSGSGSQITVLSVSKDLFGTAIEPGTFAVSKSTIQIKDDGHRNLYITSGNNTVYIGNIFYEHGIGVITHQSYQDVFPKPPLARNDYVYYRSYDSPKTITPLTNDYGRSGTIVPSTLKLSGSQASLFSYDGVGTLTLNSNDGGNYSVYYTVSASIADYCDPYLGSNKAKIIVYVANCKFNGGSAVYIPPPTPTPTIPPTPTPSVTPSPTPSPSATPTPSVTPSPSATPTPSVTPSPTQTPSPTATLAPENYTITLLNPGSNNISNYQLGGTFNTGDTVVITTTWNGNGGTVPPSNSGRADLLLSNSSAGVSDTALSSCVPVGSMLTWSLTATITFTYNVANSAFSTTATVNNGSASSSTLTTTITSVNGIPVGSNVIGNSNNQSAAVC
jgi:hypothetical protein